MRELTISHMISRASSRLVRQECVRVALAQREFTPWFSFDFREPSGGEIVSPEKNKLIYPNVTSRSITAALNTRIAQISESRNSEESNIDVS